MSFTLLLDTLRTNIPTLTGFDSKAELTNAFQPETCPEGELRDGWGLTFGAAREDTVEFTGNIANNHDFSVVLTREVVSVDGDPTPLMEAIKSLKADALTLQREILDSDRMGLPDAVELIRYSSTDPIEHNNGQDFKWLRTAVSFSATVRESL